ncbi:MULTISPECIES: acetyltransferase [Lysinibacillus]|uniref:Acetyltransferase n=1 Tax=Lysinibacillus xylanilyticus TaxID=582475 RepID=A0ABV3VWV6_9BACI
MKDLIIIGAGGLGREILSYAIEKMETGDCEWRIKGFLNDELDSLDNIETGYPILGTIKDHIIEENAVYLCAIGDSESRLSIGRNFQEKGAEFINFIHPTAKVRDRAKIGVGTILCPNSHVNPDTVIGDFVLINSNSGIAHDCIIGDGCSLIGGNLINGRCLLGKCVFLGSNAIVIPERRIGDFAKISAGAVVFTHVKSGKTMIGNPAKVLK